MARIARVLGRFLFCWRRRKSEDAVHRPLARKGARGRSSNEIMHVTDWFTTLIHAAGLKEPPDREIDGVDQLEWLCGKTESSKREGFLYWMGPELYGAKWQNFKLVLKSQRYMFDSVETLPTPRLINLTTDPHERERIPLPHLHTWAAYHLNHIIGAFQESVRREPLIPMGAPLDHVVARRPGKD